jgi:hypothetical protein
MASALLMAWNPDQHTVIDRRAVKSLVAHEEIPNPAPNLYPPYLDYLAVCQEVSRRCGRCLRKVDHALWAAQGAREIQR